MTGDARPLGTKGYLGVYVGKDHPKADARGWMHEHIYRAEQALGKPLPPGAEVHHVNGVVDDNRNQNLVVCESHAYHMLLHRRQRAIDACGNPNYAKCYICGKYDDPKNLRIYSKSQHHRSCCVKQWRKRAKENGTERKYQWRAEI